MAIAVAAAVAVTLFATRADLFRSAAETAEQRLCAFEGKSQARLSDGSTVWLHGGSTLTCDARFAAGERRVKLRGEGFFEVAKDSERPFTVEVEGLEISVHGTKFNVRTAADRYVSVSLVEGSVSLDTGRGSRRLLRPGEIACYDPDTRKVVIGRGNVAMESCWAAGKLAFERQSLGEICHYMARWYDTEIHITPALAAEEYTLAVTPRTVEILGGSPQAVFYALQTLRQLVATDGTVPAVVVRDKPCFAHRGGMLDSGRHFWTVDEVKRFIDILAMHKLNVFHWHLSEDQGWRIEIKRYPLLTEIGSVRRETVIGRYDKTDESRNRYDGKPYGGFYTQDDVRAIVAYAAERYIEVIPEIDMPGHMLGALASYPQLGCRGQGYEVWTHWGISKDVLCAGKEETFEFVENVLAEVLDLFPSKFIHVGGDECPKERWKECPACQRRIREEGLANENELQSYFMHRVEKWLHEHGRELIGWDEIMQGGISKSAVIMAWTDQFRGTDAARKGNRVIMTPKWNCYLDYSQTSDPEKYEPIGPTRYLSMRQVYRLDPYDRLKPAEYRNILGIQGNVWTEYIADFGHVQRMTLPRMAAIAEIAWAYDRKDYDDFEKRAKRLLPELYGNAKLKFSEFFFEDIE